MLHNLSEKCCERCLLIYDTLIIIFFSVSNPFQQFLLYRDDGGITMKGLRH